MQTVCCPSCQGWSRIREDAIGQIVTCPYCGAEFQPVAESLSAVDTSSGSSRSSGGSTNSSTEAVASFGLPKRSRSLSANVSSSVSSSPLPSRTLDKTKRNEYFDETDLDRFESASISSSDANPSPTLLALCLVPLGLPLAWWAARFFVPGVTPVFSFAAPAALAVCLLGLCFGVAYAAGWSLGTRFRIVLMLVLCGYGMGGFLYFLKKEWAEALRENIAPPEPPLREFKPPDNSYVAAMPGQPRLIDGDSAAAPGWNFVCYRAGNDRKPEDKASVLTTSYVVGIGKPPASVPLDSIDDDWFREIRDAIANATGAEVRMEKRIQQQSYPGREYVFSFPDGGTTRIVRVFRAKRSAFYLAAEGAFLTPDTRNVKNFFDKFVIAPNVR